MIVHPPVERYMLICRKCGWRGNDDRALTIPHSPPNGVLDSVGCPSCRRWNTLHRKCDEPGCWFEASHMNEVPGGVRLTCFKHLPTNVISPPASAKSLKP